MVARQRQRLKVHVVLQALEAAIGMAGWPELPRQVRRLGQAQVYTRPTPSGPVMLLSNCGSTIRAGASAGQSDASAQPASRIPRQATTLINPHPDAPPLERATTFTFTGTDARLPQSPPLINRSQALASTS